MLEILKLLKSKELKTKNLFLSLKIYADGSGTVDSFDETELCQFLTIEELLKYLKE